VQQLTLYVDGYFVNQWDACCMVALEEKGVPYATARALLRDGGGVPRQLSDHTGIARVPALQHGDTWLTESSAIVEYLEDMFPPPSHGRLLPADPRARARARQLMSFVRYDAYELRDERSWWMCVYPAMPPPLSARAERHVRELCELATRVVAAGELAEWNIAHADLALTLLRAARTGTELPPDAQRLLDANLVRPSVRAYVEHPRPPHPPPRALAAG
jgi:glutathione S-transferase